MEWIQSVFSEYGIFAMIVIIFLEYACFPVSSEIVLPFSGAIARAEGLPFLLLLPLSVLAGLLGTGVCYALGRIGGNALLDGLIRRFPKSEKGITASRERFGRYGAVAVCLLRVIPLCRTYIAFIAGAAGQPAAVFFPYSLLGITVWNSLLISLGYFLQENWGMVSSGYERYKHILLPVFACALLFFLGKKLFSLIRR